MRSSGALLTHCGGGMDASEYKHAVLGLIFLKDISDAFEEARTDYDCVGAEQVGR